MFDEFKFAFAIISFSLLIMFLGFTIGYRDIPINLPNDCIVYEEVYYCPTDMPEGLVMPVE